MSPLGVFLPGRTHCPFRKAIRFWGICAWTLFAALVAWTRADIVDGADAAFEAANRLYEQGRFLEAARAYEELQNRGLLSSALLYNLGNAWFKGGQIGRAIASYRLALQWAPRDPEVRANLHFARQQVQGATWRPSWYEAAFERLTLNKWTILVLVPFWGTMLLLTLRQVRPAWKTRLAPWVWIGSVVTAVTAACLVAAVQLRLHRPMGVVVVGNAQVRSGPFEESPALFTVRDGAELRILDRKDRWVRVTADGQQSGWLPEDQLIPLGPG
ncbi:SH3 domain-containing protein [Limisphaera sp. VF-2]|uniref:SH3 domain-containing protein n=1 Tax=Limisphaera sp. VF-2 TaxID=3400418 RepID=UPI003C18B651